MRVYNERPPMFDEIKVAFPMVLTKNGVLFAWGDAIYNPDAADIPAELMAHEQEHCRRQFAFGDIKRWWLEYMHIPEFRLREEVPAHQAEYREFCRHHLDRNKRAMALHRMALRLSSAFYGGLIKHHEAVKLLAPAAYS